MALLKALPGAPDFKALPGSAKINGEPVKDNQPIKGKLISIKKSVINIGKFLDRKKKQTEKQKENYRKQKQNFKRKKKEEKLEEPKKEWKKLVPKKVPGLSFLDSIKKFVTTWILGFVAIKLIPLLPKLIPVVIGLGKIVNWFINLGGKFLNGFISFIDFGIKAQEATLGFIKNLGGEKFANAFERFMKAFGAALDLMFIVGLLTLQEALSGDSGFGLGDILGKKGLKKGLAKLFGKKAAGGALVKTTAGGVVKKTGMAVGTKLAVAGSVGLLASGLGEGAFQLKKVGQKQEADTYKRFKDAPGGWLNPMKYIWGGIHVSQKFVNSFIGNLGVLLDIIGAPFRYLIELVRYPFLDEEGKKKQAQNLAKFDARIREQLRENVNAISLGIFAKEKGSFGSLFGKKGTDAMGYTKDGKPKSQKDAEKTQKTKETFKVEDGIVVGGTGTQEEYEKLKKLQRLEEEEENAMFDYGINSPEHNAVIKKRLILEGVPPEALYISKDGSVQIKGYDTSGGKTNTSDRKKNVSGGGFKRMIGGVADFLTGGMFDFDKRNRKGAPKDFGIRRIAGGLADWATMGLTDFDKRGKGNLQFNPIGGGKDKAWGSRNEQAKRREKQSGFGLKRGIGGALDFATLGMFDFDKQNRRGAPKGFGIKRIAGGLADFVTAGATDFDKRGTGIGQMKLGEIMSKKKAYENNARVSNFRNRKDELYDKFNQLPMETTVNPDGSITSKGSGELIGGELFRPGQPLTQRQYSVVKMSMQMGNTYGDDVMKSYTMYEQQGGNIVKDNVKGSSDLKLGKQPMKFDEELLGVSASYETDGGQKEYTIYAPSTEINMIQGNDSGQLVTSGTTASSGDDPYEILEKG